MKDIDAAIQHCLEVAHNNDVRKQRYDDASGYTRSGNEDIRTTEAKQCEQCAADHRQLAEWLKDYKRLLCADGDAISREMALKEAYWITTANGERFKVVQEETLLGLPSVKAKSRWIPVSEQLPEVGNLYDGYLRDSSPCLVCGIAEYGDDETSMACAVAIYVYSEAEKSGSWTGAYDYAEQEFEVAAWMPLPEVYQEVRNGKNNHRDQR